MYTAARSPNSHIVFSCSPEYRVVVSAAVLNQSDAIAIRRFRNPWRNAHSCVLLGTLAHFCALLGNGTDSMKPYEKLDRAEREWTVAETADFLGYSVKHLYRLIHQGKIEGWRRVDGGHIMFCPCRLKIWIEQSFNGNGTSKPSTLDGAGKETSGETPFAK